MDFFEEADGEEEDNRSAVLHVQINEVFACPGAPWGQKLLPLRLQMQLYGGTPSVISSSSLTTCVGLPLHARSLHAQSHGAAG